jgi:hypothetical protein
MKLKYLFSYLLFCFCFCGICNCSEDKSNDKVYIDEEEMKGSEDSFYIHLGHNTWLHTNTVHRDSTGLYTYQASIAKCMRGAKQVQYEKKWKCPYCYNYWPIGTACQNLDCPSRYF